MSPRPVAEWREELVALGRQAVRWGEEREVNWGRWPGVQVHRPSVHTAWATVQQEGPHPTMLDLQPASTLRPSDLWQYTSPPLTTHWYW